MEEREAEALGCIGFRLRKSSRLVTAFYDRRFRPTGIRVTQWPILSALRIGRRLSLRQLAEAVGVDASTLSRNVQPLVRDGYVSLDEATEDSRRQKFAALTSAGHAKWEEAFDVWQRAQAELMGAVDDAWSGVQAALDRLDARAEGDGTTAPS
jgi:DNA-binding MarR family transcriptional regulator